MQNMSKSDREIYNKLKLEASTDPHLGLLTFGWRGKVEFIYDGENKVGFFHPQMTEAEGIPAKRAGVVFVAKKYLKKGLAKKALQTYFGKDEAVAWVLKKNKASLALFKSLGFEDDTKRSNKMLNGDEYRQLRKRANSDL